MKIKFSKIHLTIIALIIALFIGTAQWFVWHQKDQTYTDIEAVPYNKVGVVLGTSKYLTNGNENLFYRYRINAAYQLYQAQKVDFLLVSGDNGTHQYDEPTTMKNDLIQKGIPANKIYLDYAGFRTLDSMIRTKEVFGQQRFTVISQPFHNERAIAIAQWNGCYAVGFNAKSVSGRYGIKVYIREFFARVKMMLDLIFGKEPKFYGPKIDIH